MSRFARTIHIEAPATDVWAALVDVETWPSWASQFKRLQRLGSGPLELGSRVRVTPQGMPGSEWRVTEFEAGRLFTWESSLAPGLRLVGGHELKPVEGSTDAEFWLDAEGPLGAVAGPVLRRTIFSRNTKSATEGLKRHLESRSSPPIR